MCHVVVMLVCWRIPNCKRTVEVMEQHWPCYAMPWLFNMYTQLKDTRYSVTFLYLKCSRFGQCALNFDPFCSSFQKHTGYNKDISPPYSRGKMRDRRVYLNRTNY